MVGRNYIVLRKITNKKLYCLCHHLTAGTNELVPANGDLHLLYNSQLYVQKSANKTKYSKSA